MKENRGRNEVAWNMYQRGHTYQEMAEVLGITRQRAWGIVQSGLRRELVKVFDKSLSPATISATIDKKETGV